MRRVFEAIITAVWTSLCVVGREGREGACEGRKKLFGERRLLVGEGWFVVVSSAKLVRRRQSAGVGVGASGCGSASAEETRADGRKVSQRTKEKSLHFLSFSLGFFWGVCVCREASSLK